MKKLAVLLFALAIGIYSLYATNIPGGNVSGTWTLAGSPYIIQGSIMIPNNTTLTIEPGVVVNFQGTYKLYVQGRIIAVGTAIDTIIFTAANTTNGWRGIRFDNTPTSNDTSKLIFCKIQYGKATGTSPDNNGGGVYLNTYSKVIISQSNISNCTANYSGAGIYCTHSSPYISNNIIFNNVSEGDFLNSGAGITCVNGSNPIISNNNILYNTANYSGGIFCESSNPTIKNNQINYNSSIQLGGGIYCLSCSPLITNNNISNNLGDYGGGISCFGASPTISNNLIINNNSGSESHGGGIYCGTNGYISSNPILTNNTISNNKASNGGALYCDSNSDPTFINNIAWGNTASISGSQVFLADEYSDPNFYYCNIQGGEAAFALNNNFYTGIYQNNINSDPHFVSPSVGSGTGYNGQAANWYLLCSSPCINSGNPSGTYPGLDFAGNPRVVNGIIDIGAYEYSSISLPVANAGPDETVCGNTYTLEAIPSVCLGTWTVLSGPGSVTFADQNSSTSNILVVISGIYALVWTENIGGLIDADTVFIQFTQTITSTFVASNVPCYGDYSTITYTGNASMTANYNWDLNGATILSGSGAGPYSVKWDSVGSQAISLSVFQDGCQSDLTTINVVNPPALSASLTSTNVSSNGTNDGSVDLTTLGGTPSYIYHWNNSATTEDITGLGAGTYSVTITDSNGCTYAIATNIVIGINEIGNINNFNIYPNPAQTAFNISFSNPFSGKAEITDINGRILKTVVINADKQISIGIYDLPSGEYLVVVKDKQQITRHNKICILR